MASASGFDRHLCLCVDVQGYGSTDDRAQAEIQHELLRLLEFAAEAADLDRASWFTQGKGDEELALVPLGASEPRMVDDFVRHLDSALTRLNAPRLAHARMRLRVAVHQGVAYRSGNGFAGQGVVVVSRLINAAPVRRALAGAQSANLVLVISQGVFEDVILQGHTTLTKEQFFRVRVQEKEFDGDAWIYVPGVDPARLAEAVDDIGQVTTPPQPGDRSEAVSAAFAGSVAPPLGMRDPRRPLRGRDEMVADLLDLLANASKGPRVQVLHGLGGCGKTSVALELAALAASENVQVWWVRAANHRALAAYMQAVARDVGATDIEVLRGQSTDILWQRLEAYEKKWLLIVDGANDPALLAGATELADGTGWIRPHNLPGLVVVTTRDGDPQLWGPWCSLRPVGALDSVHAGDVLLDYAPPQAGNSAAALELAQRLGGLPLALRLAGSYLAETNALPQAWAPADAIRTFAAYRQALDAGRLDVIAGPGDESLIGQAWEMSLELLSRRNMPQASSLLTLLSMFSEAPIPYQTLLNPALLSSSPLFDDIDGAGLWRLLRAAADLGLITSSWRSDPFETGGASAPPVLRLHPLVRDTGRHQAATEGQYAAYVDLASALLGHAASAAGNTPEDPFSWSQWQALAPHAFQLLHADCVNAALPVDTVRRIAGVAMQATRHLFGRGLYRAADVEFRFLLEVLRQALGEDHPDTLAARHGFASLLHDRGLYKEAEHEFQALIRARVSLLGEDAPQTLVARNELAQVWHDSGQRSVAEAEFRSVLSRLRRVLGDDHPLTLSTRYDFARVLSARAEHGAAEREFRAVAAARGDLFGEDHPDTLLVHAALAYLHHECGKLMTAERGFRSVWEAFRRILGEDHPKTLAMRNNLARVLHDLGRLDEARSEFTLVLGARRQVLGASHPNTLTTRHNLARVLLDIGSRHEAEREFKEVLEVRRHVLGSDHPDTASTESCLSSLRERPAEG